MPSREEPGSDFVSIVVADATRIHTQLLADALRNDPGLQVVAAASNSEELLAAITRVPIDVVVISHNLDDQPGHGIEVLRQMRALRPHIKGVILLDSNQPEEVLECFRAGARGIFSKQGRLENLCKCIRSVHEGQVWARSADLDHALEALATLPLVRANSHKGIELLSARERQVIQHLAAGMTNREIAETLDLSPHTIKNYLFRIFDKVGVSSRTELLYLTMHNPPVEPVPAARAEAPSFSLLIQAAEAGDPLAQLNLAEHFRHLENGPGEDGKFPGAQPDPISAYTWYLLAEKMAAPMLVQIEEGKKNLIQTMSPEEVAEAEHRAAAWLRNTGERRTVARATVTGTNGRKRKMHAGAR
jgi:DNA-binding NarL/FixJ family response regulator